MSIEKPKKDTTFSAPLHGVSIHYVKAHTSYIIKEYNKKKVSGNYKVAPENSPPKTWAFEYNLRRWFA